jgi:Transposase DDE domain
MPTRADTKKPVSRVRNGKRYKHVPVSRGSLTLRVGRATPQASRYPRPAGRRARFDGSDTAILCPPTLKDVYPLTPQATEGLARLMVPDLPGPDYASLCRPARMLGIEPPRVADGPLHLVIDSTGLTVYGEGKWKARQEGSSGRRTWPKLQLEIEPKTHEIRAPMVSDPGVTDSEAIPGLLERAENPVIGASADGACGRRKLDEELGRRGARAVITVRRDAVIRRRGNESGPRPVRDEDLLHIRRIGRAAWKEESGHHRRSLGETAMSRMKAIFGCGVLGRSAEQLAEEIGLRCRAVNVMTPRGCRRAGGWWGETRTRRGQDAAAETRCHRATTFRPPGMTFACDLFWDPWR